MYWYVVRFQLTNDTLNYQLADSYTVKIERIDVNQARQLVKQNQFTSAIGHESTAKLLSMLLGIDIPMNRIQIQMTSGIQDYILY
ncbi:MAG: STIV orfB116 family protein [Candidatus Sericytochromatia bacterium]